jgi:ubiquinone/menaquinone biosynthesis C-methylase UbiE
LTRETGIADLQGPAGNVYDKHGTHNPFARLLVAWFLSAAGAAVDDVAPATVLDVGCGEGVVTGRLAQRLPQARVVGLDVDDAKLAAEWKARPAHNLAFEVGSAYALPYENGAFDLVCAFEVLEHMERPEEALSELARVAREALVLSVPREPIWRVLNVLSGRYLREWGNTPGHVNHWSRKQFVRFAGSAGEVVAVRNPPPWAMVTVRKRG